MGAPGYGYGYPPPAPPPPPSGAAWGLGAAIAALGLGVVTFLYVGMLGGRASAEVVIGLLGATSVASLLGFVGGVLDLRRNAARRGAVALVLSAIPIALVAATFVLDKLHRDSVSREHARAFDDDDDDRRRRSKNSAASASVRASDGGTTSGAEGGPIKIELFTMSQCPYCLPVDAALHEVQKTLGADVKIEINYVGKVDEAGTLTSMHGPDEVTGDLAQVCVAKRSSKLLEFIVCQNQDNKTVATNWRTCALDIGVSMDELGKCIQGEEGKALLAASFRATQAKDVRAAPTIFVAGAKHQGPRHKNDFLRAVCAAYKGAAPAACTNIPDAPKVKVTLLTDARCAECDPKKATTHLTTRVSNPVITTVDYATPEGKALFNELRPIQLPAAIFDASLDADPEALNALGKSLVVAGDRRVAKLGEWDPSCADDCNKPGCSANAACTKKPSRVTPP